MAGISSRKLVPLICSVVTLAGSAGAITIDVDGINYTTLSQAVDAAYASPDTEKIINIAVNDLPMADPVQIQLDQPITINGDGENNGVGDGIPCNILVDNATIRDQTNVGVGGIYYLELTAPGMVNISDLRIRPILEGEFTTSNGQIVLGVQCARPANLGDVGEYTLTRVEISGNNFMDEFVELDTGDDLYNEIGTRRWAGHSGGDAAQRGRGLIQLDDGGGDGIYNTLLDHCKAGLSFAPALNMNALAGVHEVFGGVYGHCGRDAIHVQGTGVTLRGTHDDRLRVVRSTNISGANSHGIEAISGSDITLIEYADIAGVNTANCLALQNGCKVRMIRHVRAMGKFTKTTNNHCVYIVGDSCDVDAIENCTFHANSQGNLGLVAMAVQPSITNSIAIKDTIFTSENDGVNFGYVTVGPTDPAAVPTFDNCAVTSDGLIGESLGMGDAMTGYPIQGAGADLVTTSTCITASPQYALTLDDYDWSDNQGAGEPGNGPGNLNVYRPTNPVYNTAGSGGTPLYGGAGSPSAGIDPRLWMLM